jgi:hypothetical protein
LRFLVAAPFFAAAWRSAFVRATLVLPRPSWYLTRSDVPHGHVRKTA